MAKPTFDQLIWSSKFRKRRQEEVSRNSFLRKIPFFEALSDKQLKLIAQHLHERRYEENDFLFEVNHPGAALFIIMRGEVSVETLSSGQVTQLALIRPGEFLGELALLDDSPRSASARAVRPTQAYALFRGDLLKLTQEEPEIACEIYRALAWVIGERLKATNRHVDTVRKAG